MCPLCIMSAITLGGGAALAGGIDWAKAKLFKTENAGDGCQTLQLQEDRASEELSGAACQPASEPGE